MPTEERTLWRDVPIPASRTIPEKLRALVLPGTLTFRGTSFFDALAFLRQESVRLDTDEADELRRGVPVWILDGGERCTSGVQGESRRLDRMVAHLGCRLECTNLPLGTALDVLARGFALEMQVTEAAVFLWLPGALPGGRINVEALGLLKLEILRAGDLRRRHGC